MKPLFTLGQVVATPGALAALEKAGQQPGDFISRHVRGDWGDVPPEDVKENEFSLRQGFRLLSAYRTHHGRQALGDYRSRPFVNLYLAARRVLK